MRIKDLNEDDLILMGTTHKELLELHLDSNHNVCVALKWLRSQRWWPDDEPELLAELAKIHANYQRGILTQRQALVLTYDSMYRHIVG